MKSPSRVSVPWTVLVACALGLVAVGAGTTYLRLRSTRDVSPAPPVERQAPSTSMTPTAESLPDVAVPLTKEGARRAGIKMTTVTAGAVSGGLRAPGVVEPNTYKLVVVTPVSGGRITQVTAELGQSVQRGQTIARIFSPELAESQTRYIAARADLEAHERELARAERLVQLGSASRQELERLHADHTALRAGLQSAASRLRLLGLSESAIEALDPGKALDATINVPAPIAGVITERTANVGLNVDSSTKLFTVVDLSSVWIVADVYEKDFARVKVGASARVTTSAYPDRVLQGRISYIDPTVSAGSRTARIRVEVANPRRELRLGMLAEVLLGDAGDAGGVALIPRGAVQNVGDRTVVYLVNPQNAEQFTEREVRLGAPAGDQIPVLSGVQPGDVVVSEGSFHVRAERERLGLRPGTAPNASGVDEQRAGASVQTARIVVGEQGYEPSTVSLRAGVPARVTFVRTSDKTCGAEVVFPALDIRRALPLNQPVAIEFTPSKAGEIAFACGMAMWNGTIVVGNQ